MEHLQFPFYRIFRRTDCSPKILQHIHISLGKNVQVFQLTLVPNPTLGTSIQTLIYGIHCFMYNHYFYFLHRFMASQLPDHISIHLSCGSSLVHSRPVPICSCNSLSTHLSQLTDRNPLSRRL